MSKPNNLYNPELKEKARHLRKNLTPQERKLWYGFLSGLSVRFKRQKIIDSFIVDFCCNEKKLIIELDGDQHYNTHSSLYKDKSRDDFLDRLGFKVLRYSNYEIDLNFDEVCKEIKQNLR